MTTYAEIAHALKMGGYLSDADPNVVIAVLVDGLVIQDTADVVAEDEELSVAAAITGACTNAANTLATAGLIDSANAEITAALISDLWFGVEDE